MTEEQLVLLAAGIRAETNQTCVDALAIRNDVAMTEWINGNSAQDAWNPSMSSGLLFEATNVAKFDGLTAGKRDSWRLMLDFAPVDMSRNKVRKAVVDAWGNADSVAVLASCVRKATNGEKYLGGNSATENTVTAWKLAVPGNIGMNEISTALNRY